ncbi:MAG: hypothetical protein WDO14_19655 [Bacteroidota bacterium]
MNSIARFISVVFHPLLVTTYLFIILSLFLPEILYPILPSKLFIGLMLLMTFVLPSLNFILFKITGTIKDIQMFNRKDRIMPFIFVTILYVVVTYMFFKNYHVPNVVKLMEIITIMVIVSTVITFFYKISVHSVAICGLIGILLALNNASDDGMLVYPTIGVTLVAGVVMSSRLQLDAHTPREVAYGGMLGFMIGLGGVMILF